MKIQQHLTDAVNNTISPFMFGYFLKSMAALLVYDSATRLMQVAPSVEIGGEKQSGSAIRKPDFCDIAELLCGGGNLIRITGQSQQLISFLEWLLQEEGPVSDDGMNMWNEFTFLVDKWNEFASLRNGEEEDEDE